VGVFSQGNLNYRQINGVSAATSGNGMTIFSVQVVLVLVLAIVGSIAYRRHHSQN